MRSVFRIFCDSQLTLVGHPMMWQVSGLAVSYSHELPSFLFLLRIIFARPNYWSICIRSTYQPRRSEEPKSADELLGVQYSVSLIHHSC